MPEDWCFGNLRALHCSQSRYGSIFTDNIYKGNDDEPYGPVKPNQVEGEKKVKHLWGDGEAAVNVDIIGLDGGNPKRRVSLSAPSPQLHLPAQVPEKTDSIKQIDSTRTRLTHPPNRRDPQSQMIRAYAVRRLAPLPTHPPPFCATETPSSSCVRGLHPTLAHFRSRRRPGLC